MLIAWLHGWWLGVWITWISVCGLALLIGVWQMAYHAGQRARLPGNVEGPRQRSSEAGGLPAALQFTPELVA